MRISTARDALFAHPQTVTRPASTRSAVQAPSGVQLQAKGGAIELRATDMEIGLRVPLEGEVVRDGAVVLPARLLVDVVRALPGDSVSLELRPAEQDVEIVAGSATFHIRTLRLEDFPPFPAPAPRRGPPSSPGPPPPPPPPRSPSGPPRRSRSPRATAAWTSPAPRSSRRCSRWRAPRRATRRARSSPASSCPPRRASC